MAVDVTVEFDAGTNSLDALNAAAYRLIGTATCQIELSTGRYICRLTPTANASRGGQVDLENIRNHFLDLVTDESVREGLRKKTEPLRNMILSLAFGSLAVPPADKP
jgi:His-Xaa-Ser system protein HxsD